MRDAVFRSVEVADAYASSQCQSLGREIRLLADDLTRARAAYDVDRKWFETFLTVRATALGVPVAAIMQPPDKVLVRANIDVLRNAPKAGRRRLRGCAILARSDLRAARERAHLRRTGQAALL